MTAVLLAEDDPAISDPLARALRREGYDVEVAADGAAALAAGAAEGVELVVLDLGLPDMDGLDVARRLRENRPSLALLMLTARADEIDVVVGLDAGADDYVVKPFRLAELLARIRALVRRTTPTAVRVNGIALDSQSRRVWRDDQEVALTVKEFDLLATLIREAGTVVPRERVLREVWGVDWYGSAKTLDMHVSTLRRKLGDDAVGSRYLTTIRGVGFRFEQG